MPNIVELEQEELLQKNIYLSNPENVKGHLDVSWLLWLHRKCLDPADYFKRDFKSPSPRTIDIPKHVKDSKSRSLMISKMIPEVSQGK